MSPAAVLVALGVLASSLAGSYWLGRSHGVEAEFNRNAAAALKAEQSYRAEEARKVVTVSEIANAYAAKVRANAAAAASAASAADGLRTALDDARASVAAQDSAADARADAERTLGIVVGLLAESGQLLATGKAAGDRLAAQVAGLQEDRRKVCVTP